ncbi:YihY/virulence factor BrkB family protein [Profundibacterium mesophilum]|uniref:Virulence factor BrkB domain containing protein n=1 Tax=Profundibacterium mesophilum KAUST100406-0324 TaxID=1037889 RepID=A0A921TDJ5_9RHOB|nr:YihY/virulence factor BrkB family protein [Profundibacterium mesophilum]KAF0676411.1 Virulence factor BrkB domain containing protein [Profundibacterium mesophilum KAUST100406-0324]
MAARTKTRTQKSRGREAERPSQIPKPGWRDILLRTKNEITNDHVSVVAAGVAFFGLLAIFPTIAAMISIAGLVLDPAAMQEQIAQLAGMLPQDAADILREQANQVAADDTSAGITAVISIALAIYGASKGMKTLMEGMNIAYDEEEKRGFIRYNITALVLTVILILGLVMALSALIAAPAAVAAMGLPGWVDTLIIWARWPLMAVLTVFGLDIIYRYGPSRENPQWRWINWGSVLAMIIWVAGSIGFSIYVTNFGSYSETYGAIGGVIILLTWLWLSAFIVLLGAELNSEMEHQTAEDTTTGAERPIGKRGAAKADTLGKSP